MSKFLPAFSDLYWPDTWSQVHSMPLDRHVVDTNWKISHGVIYTAERLVNFGMNVEPSCHCGAPLETLQHLFFDCPVAQAVLQSIYTVFKSAVPPCPPLTARHLLFGFSPDERQAVPPVFSYVLNLCKFFLWLSRNNYRFRDTAPSVPDIITSVRQRLFFFLPLFKKHFVSDTRKRKFNRCWNVLGKFWANTV